MSGPPKGWRVVEPAAPPKGWRVVTPEADDGLGVPDSPLPPGMTLDQPAAPESPDEFDPEALARGAGQGLTYMFQDEGAGAVPAVVSGGAYLAKKAAQTAPGRALARAFLPGADVLPDAAVDAMTATAADDAAQLVTGVRPKGDLRASILAAYTQNRDEERRANDAARERSPLQFGGAQIAGAVLAPGPKVSPYKPFNIVGKRALEYAGVGATQGAASALGQSDADLTEGEFGEALRDTGGGALKGAAVAGVLGPAAEVGWGRVAKPWLAQQAAERAVSAVMPSNSIGSVRAARLGINKPEGVRRVGDEILAADVLRPFSGAPATLERVRAGLAQTGEGIGQKLAAGDELAAEGVGLPFRTQTARIATRQAMRDAADTNAARVELPPIQERLLQRIGEERPNELYSEAWKNKSQLQRALVPNEMSELGDDLYRAGVGGYTRNIYRQLESQIGPDEAADFSALTKRYGTLARIEEPLMTKASRQAQNSKVGLLDMQAGLVAGGDPASSTAIALGSSFLRGGRGDAAAALAARRLGKMTPETAGAGAALGAKINATKPVNQSKLTEDDEDAVSAYLRQ